MKATYRVLNSTSMFLLMVVWLAFYFGAHLWPASHWLEVRSVSAGPARMGEHVPMVVDREIKRPFHGKWTVIVRQWENEGWVEACSASGYSQYRAGNDLPAKLTLAWWTGGKCTYLFPGRYVISTTWQIEPTTSFLPPKRVSAEGNIFEVTP